MEKQWKTTNDLKTATEMKEDVRLKRSIKFDSKVRVILIPTRQEYCDVGLGEALWWSSSDYGFFKESAGRELRAMLELYGMDAKAVLAQMYQPDSNERSDDKNGFPLIKIKSSSSLNKSSIPSSNGSADHISGEQAVVETPENQQHLRTKEKSQAEPTESNNWKKELSSSLSYQSSSKKRTNIYDSNLSVALMCT